MSDDTKGRILSFPTPPAPDEPAPASAPLERTLSPRGLQLTLSINADDVARELARILEERANGPTKTPPKTPR